MKYLHFTNLDKVKTKQCFALRLVDNRWKNSMTHNFMTDINKLTQLFILFCGAAIKRFVEDGVESDNI